VWHLLALRPGGSPWLCVAGKLLTGWTVIDIDATLITAHSAKAGAAATFKKGSVRHEAPRMRVGVRGLHRRAVAATWRS
jgi:hypothetical protein